MCYINFKSLIKLTQYITHFRSPVKKILYITSDETMHEGMDYARRLSKNISMCTMYNTNSRSK